MLPSNLHICFGISCMANFMCTMVQSLQDLFTKVISPSVANFAAYCTSVGFVIIKECKLEIRMVAYFATLVHSLALVSSFIT